MSYSNMTLRSVPPAFLLLLLLAAAMSSSKTIDAFSVLVDNAAASTRGRREHRRRRRPRRHSSSTTSRIRDLRQQQILFAGKDGTDNDDPYRILQARVEDRKKESLVRAAMMSSASDDEERLTKVRLVGQARLPGAAAATGGRRNRTATTTTNCAVLASAAATAETTTSSNDPIPCLLLPLGGNNGNGNAQLKLLEFVAHGRPVSKSVMLSLNSLLVNRDRALFDNAPWSAWSVDPRLRNRDAAGNPVSAKFHLGKRDAYNRFAGKDWQGKSLAVGNLALRLKYLLEKEEERGEDRDDGSSGERRDDAAALDVDDDDDDDDYKGLTLARRILELKLREQEMDLAEWDYRIAVRRQQQSAANDGETDDVDDLQLRRRVCSYEIDATKQRLEELVRDTVGDGSAGGGSRKRAAADIVANVLQDVADWTTGYGENAAPYRGAIGYAPMLDGKRDVQDSVLLPYTSPYDLMAEILRDQLNAEVIGAVLENTSLLQGTLAVGGAVVLRRITPKRKVTIAGESLEVNDEDEEFGNEGIRGGETIVVECDSDEAIGMAMACNASLQVESSIWERASVMSQQVSSRPCEDSQSVRSALPLWSAVDPELSVLVEGQAGNLSATERVVPLRVPRTTTSLFYSMFDSSTQPSSKNLFPTDNPIQSLSRYDSMSNEDKAVTLMTMSNFEGRLPRPRVVRQSEKNNGGMNALDRILLPLVDESVRRQYLVRDAERRGDFEEAEALKGVKSRRQVAKEKAEQARELGEEDVAEWWDNEANLYGSLRADVTQDEGSYSRFL